MASAGEAEMGRKIVLIGGTGQLGTELLPRLARLGRVLAPERQTLDLASTHATARIAALQPTHIVHAAAATDVERCEREPEWGQAVNAEGARRVAEACRAVGASLVYVSTDYVFDGTKRCPYLEGDPPAPLNAYGRSKLDGEAHVQAVAPRWTIVRTAWLYGHVGRNFVATILGRLRAGDLVRVVSDQVGSPTYAGDLAEGIAQLVACEATGIFHLTNGGACSWFEFARAIAREAGADPTQVVGITSAELGLRARRPAYAVLANAAWAALGFPALRSWPAALHVRLAHEASVNDGTAAYRSASALRPPTRIGDGCGAEQFFGLT
jgi:dTDP-4-dehydrorhamnose reductase